MASDPSSRGPRAQLLDDSALFRQATEADTLLAAWSRVLANGGAAAATTSRCSGFW
jgi:hypothetical protein